MVLVIDMKACENASRSSELMFSSDNSDENSDADDTTTVRANDLSDGIECERGDVLGGSELL
jgi:hypothetical protein